MSPPVVDVVVELLDALVIPFVIVVETLVITSPDACSSVAVNS